MTTPKITFKYLDIAPIGGRGGVQRFFMLANGIAYEEQLFAYNEVWAAEKKRMIETGENPAGGVPVTIVEASKKEILSQHIATCRYLAKTNKVANDDDYKNFVQDLVADEYQGFRDSWVETAFGTNEEDKATYKAEKLPAFLTKFETLYKVYKTSDVYLSTSSSGNPLWGDAAMFGLIYDNIQTGLLSEAHLAKYPNLDGLYKAYGAIPAVATWIDAHKK